MRPRLTSIALGLLAGVILLTVTLRAAGITAISVGSSLPGSCVNGNIYIKTGTSKGAYWCDGGSWVGPLITTSGAGTVSTSGSPASGNLAKFSGSTAVTNGNLSGDVTTSDTLATTIVNAAVSLAKIANAAANSKLLGSGASGSGSPYTELTLGTNLSMSGTTLNAASTGAGGGASLALLEQHTASSSASLDFTSFYSSTYDTYKVEVIDVIPANDSVVLCFRVSKNGGSTWVSSGAYSHTTIYWIGGSSPASATATSDTVGTLGGYTSVAHIGQTLDGIGGSYTLHFSPTAIEKRLFGSGIYDGDPNDGAHITGFTSVSYYYESPAATTNAVQFFFSAGNMVSGTIRIYGLAK